MNKHSAQLPNGEITTRNSKTRTYTHMVAGRRSAESKREEMRAQIAGLLAEAARYEGTLEKLRAGEYRWTFRTGEAINETVEQDIEQFEKWVADHTAKAEKLQSVLDADQFEDSWHDLGWCGRPDLAQKKADSESGKYAEVQIIEARVA